MKTLEHFAIIVYWLQVFLTEYAGPLFIYLLFYMRPALIYGAENVDKPRILVVTVSSFSGLMLRPYSK